MRKYGSLFDGNQTLWWNNYIKELKGRQENPPDGPFLLERLIKQKGTNTATNRPPHPHSLLSEQDQQVHRDLEQKFAKERKTTEVSKYSNIV